MAKTDAAYDFSKTFPAGYTAPADPRFSTVGVSLDPCIWIASDPPAWERVNVGKRTEYVTFPSCPMTFFWHKSFDEGVVVYVLTEYSSGMRVGYGYSKRSALKMARGRVDASMAVNPNSFLDMVASHAAMRPERPGPKVTYLHERKPR